MVVSLRQQGHLHLTEEDLYRSCGARSHIGNRKISSSEAEAALDNEDALAHSFGLIDFNDSSNLKLQGFILCRDMSDTDYPKFIQDINPTDAWPSTPNVDLDTAVVISTLCISSHHGTRGFGMILACYAMSCAKQDYADSILFEVTPGTKRRHQAEQADLQKGFSNPLEMAQLHSFLRMQRTIDLRDHSTVHAVTQYLMDDLQLGDGMVGAHKERVKK